MTGLGGAVAAGDPREVEAGQWALARGGSAADAVVAAAFVAFVVEPWNCGIGGYGHASLWLPDRQAFFSVDHGPCAPLAATADLFTPETSTPASGYLWPAAPGDRNEQGGLSVATPGAVPGLAAIHAAGGRLPWADLLRPAIAAADRGLRVEGTFERALRRRSAVLAAGGAAGLYSSGRAGRVAFPALARTLALIRDAGPEVLAIGPMADAVAARVAAAGGLLAAHDLVRYAVRTGVEEPAQYRDLRYATGDDPVGREVLGILAATDLRAAGPAERYHLIAEACAHALIDNVAWYGDPDVEDTPVAGLGSAGFAAARAAGLEPGRAAVRPIVPADPWPWEGRPRPQVRQVASSRGGAPGTSQVCAVDADGMAVALITTVGGLFGSGVAVPELGIVLNNGMVNFDPRPDSPGRVAPGKRPFFAVPALTGVRADGTVLAVAGSGYYRILSAVVSTVVNLVEHGMTAPAAVAAPRVHSQGAETFVDARVPVAVQNELTRRGHRVVVQASTPGEPAFARVCLTVRDATGTLVAAADPADCTAVLSAAPTAW